MTLQCPAYPPSETDRWSTVACDCRLPAYKESFFRVADLHYNIVYFQYYVLSLEKYNDILICNNVYK